MAEKFYDKTIDGIEMVTYFVFPGENFDGVTDSEVSFEIGTAILIQYDEIVGKQTNYSMHSDLPNAYSDGISMVKGNIMFRVLKEDTLATIGRALMNKKVKTLKQDKIAKYSGSMFMSNNDMLIVNTVEKENKEYDLKNFSWKHVPFFDIVCITNPDKSNTSKISKLKIEGVKIQSYGQSEGTDSTEMNDMIQFLGLGEVTPWKMEGDK